MIRTAVFPLVALFTLAATCSLAGLDLSPEGAWVHQGISGSWRIAMPGWSRFLLRLVIAVVVMAAALVGMLYVMPDWATGTMPYRLLRLMIVVGAGIVAYFVTLALLGFKVKEFARRTV